MRVAAPVGAMLLLLSGCGGGGGSSTGPIALPTGSNVAPVTVDSGPAGTVNTAFVSVTVCAPGTADCQTVDHVLVDTGSSGLRLVASVLPASFTLPALEDNAGNALAECLAFADGFAFGSVKQADVKIAGEQASALAVDTLEDFALNTLKWFYHLQTAEEQGPLLAFLVGLVGARQIVEVGTFTGFSTLSMALALPAWLE